MLKVRGALALLLALLWPAASIAEPAVATEVVEKVVVGPVNAIFPEIGEPIRRPLPTEFPAMSDWSIKGWVRVDNPGSEPKTIAALADSNSKILVELGISGERVFAAASNRRIEVLAGGREGEWLLISLVSLNGNLTLRVGDGAPGSAVIPVTGTATQLVLAPRSLGRASFDGAVANFTLWTGDSGAVIAGNSVAPDADLITFENASPSWPLQTKQYLGTGTPQEASTLPVSLATEAPEFAGSVPLPTPPLSTNGEGRWSLGGWRFIAEPETEALPEAISRPGFDDSAWLPATVPGTVLTSYVENRVYPDPAIGLNNMLIPERLNRQDYWYRTEFEVPDSGPRGNRAIEFQGINYSSEIWIDGKLAGTTRGAFARGRFDLPQTYRPGQKLAVAVRVSPPPNPGLPHEESLRAGPGANGGEMTIDGPTFMASQGWDWIPSVRDRNTGIWQDVVLETTGDVRIGDPQVRTVLPRADNSLAELTIEVPVFNASDAPRTATVTAQFDDIELTRTIELAPTSEGLALFAPEEFGQLSIRNPKLWWPNGYGEPTLHDLALSVRLGKVVSDTRTIRFGIREVTYELSLVDQDERLQRVAVAPARSKGEPLIDVRHQSIRKIDGGWAVSLASAIDSTPALAAIPESTLAPNLLIRVNGVPIAVRGGNWGMDDWMKRVSRDRLEPYFRLHREAYVNTIRNWLGQSTEQVFFDLADEYGLLVINDFWISTQDHNGEPGDTALFLGNASDTISRFRYHPSIALWIGRNEGVPPPVLNTGLEQLVRQLDGTRVYLPNSRQVNMTGSGPWNYRQPADYFNKLANGFSTEIGTPSFPSLESFKEMIPEADQWPISDSWAYHDWHQGKAGDVATFMNAMRARFGEPQSLTDFENKAQLLNYESHRAIFEGMNAQLFVKNSGRLLWMTHPAWPSTAWQIYSSDYDTHASFFGTKKGMEPVHVQLNLPDRQIAIVNSLSAPINNGTIRISNYSLAGELLEQSSVAVSAPGYATTLSGAAVADALFDQSSVVLSKLELFDDQGVLLSENFYWLARNPDDYRAMTAMEQVKIDVRATLLADGKESRTEVVLTNGGSIPGLMIKLALLDETGERILPAYWSDNYVSLLPGETRTVTIQSAISGPQPKTITVGGWNAVSSRAEIVPQAGPEGP